MEKAEGIEPEEGKSIRAQLEYIMEKMRKETHHEAQNKSPKKEKKR